MLRVKVCTLSGERLASVAMRPTDILQDLANAVRRGDVEAGGLELYFDERRVEGPASLAEAGVTDGAIITAVRRSVIEVYSVQLSALCRSVPALLGRPRRCLASHLGAIEQVEGLKERLAQHIDAAEDDVRSMVVGRLRSHIEIFFMRSVLVPGFVRPTWPAGFSPDAESMRLWRTEDVLQILSCMDRIIWLRLGAPEIVYGGGRHVPQMPADILGQLSREQGSLFFYYKDCDPEAWGGGGVMHPWYCFYLSNSLWELVENMSQKDRAALFELDERWTTESKHTHDELDEHCTCGSCCNDWVRVRNAEV